MKKLLLLLAVTLLVGNLVGCGCCRRLRDTLCRGAYCGSTAAPQLTPAFATPAPIITPPVQQFVAPPQAMVAPCPQPQCAPVCSCDPCCSPDPCAQTYGYGSAPALNYPAGNFGGVVNDSGWAAGCSNCDGNNYSGAMPGMMMPQGGVPDPGPVP